MGGTCVRRSCACFSTRNLIDFDFALEVFLNDLKLAEICSVVGADGGKLASSTSYFLDVCFRILLCAPLK